MHKMTKLQTEATSYSLDVEDFIAEVKKYPVVWDLKCEDNRYKTKKQAAWSEIAKKFIADFDDLPDLEKMDVYRRLHSKWRNIRDSYVRHIKRRESKRGMRGYMYARHLSFLNNLYNPVAFSTDDEDNEGSEEDPLQRSKRRFENNESTWPSDTDELSIDLKRRRVKQETIEIDPYVSGPTYSHEDDDKSFFESLLPAVRAFTLDQKLEFRSEVLTLVKNIRHGVISNNMKVDPVDDFV